MDLPPCVGPATSLLEAPVLGQRIPAWARVCLGDAENICARFLVCLQTLPRATLPFPTPPPPHGRSWPHAACGKPWREPSCAHAARRLSLARLLPVPTLV